MTNSRAPRRSGTVAVVLAAAALWLCGGTGTPTAGAAPAVGIHNIQHVVMIMQENRSFDSYFGTYPGANGIPHGVCVPDPLNGGCVRPFHEIAGEDHGGPHAAKNAAADVAGGHMSGFVGQAESRKHCKKGEVRCLPCTSPLAQPRKGCIDVTGYHDAREIPNYWTYAKDFVLQDDMFESDASWSLPEHLSMVSAWSALCPLGDVNPLDCASSLWPNTRGIKGEAPPSRTYAWTDITYLLYKAGVSWRYFIHEGSEPDCVNDEAVTCDPTAGLSAGTPGIWNPLPSFTDVQRDGQSANVQPASAFFEDARSPGECALPNVSWVVPNWKTSEHPPSSVKAGEEWVTSLINAIMRSPCWSSTAIFLSWDDWGGFYDHVTPPSIDENGYGLRVPGLVISPFAKQGFVDHQQLSHDAYLKFIEDDFLGGARLDPATDGRPDSRPDVREEAPGLGNLGEDFDFSQEARAPLILPLHPKPGPPSKEP